MDFFLLISAQYCIDALLYHQTGVAHNNIFILKNSK